MKKVILFLMLAISTGSVAFGAETGSNKAENAVQIRQILRQDRRWNRHGNYNNNNVRYETRFVHKGNKLYKEVYRITRKNGREHVKRISRERVR